MSAVWFQVFLVMVWNFEVYMLPITLLLVFFKNLLVAQIIGACKREPVEDVSNFLLVFVFIQCDDMQFKELIDSDFDFTNLSCFLIESSLPIVDVSYSKLCFLLYVQ